MKTKNNEFAPEYSKRERVKLLLKYLVIFLPLFVLTDWLFFPWFYEYMETAHCQNYGKFTGIHLVFYGLFIGLPLFLFLLMFFTEGIRNIKVIIQGQHPLPNEKVLKPTKYTYGRAAKLKTLPILLLLVVVLGLSIYGYSAANNIIALSEETEPTCSTS